MSAEKAIRSQARQILKDNFVPAITALLILVLPYYIIDGATTAISCGILNTVHQEKLADILIYTIGYTVEVLGYYLLSPLLNGYVRAYYKATYSNTIELSDVFYYFGKGHYGKTLRLNFVLVIRMLLPILILFSPVIIFNNLCAKFADRDFASSMLYQNAIFFLSLLSAATSVLYSLRYFTVFTVSADNPQFSVREVFAYNKKIMEYRTGSAASLLLSFVPWMLLCFLVLPMLYVIPYITQSRCVSAKWLTQVALEEN